MAKNLSGGLLQGGPLKWMLGLVVVLLLAAGLRIWGINFGLPFKYHIDEPYYVVGALKLGRGDFHLTVPHNTPNIWQFLLLVEYGVLFVIGKAGGIFRGPDDLAALYVKDPSVFYLLARLSSVAAGTVTVALVYRIGREISGRLVGLLGALFLAVTFLHVRDSHYAVNDAFITLLTTATLFYSLAYLRSGRNLLLFLGALACGAAIGMKYRPVAFLVPLTLSLWLRHLSLPGGPRVISLWRTGAIVVVGAPIGFLVGFPGAIINFDVFLWHLRAAFGQAQAYEGWQLEEIPRWLFYLRSLLWGWGWPLFLTTMAGAGSWLLRRRRTEILVLSGGLAYFAVIVLPNTYFVRYALPLFPLGAIAAADLVRRLLDRLGAAQSSWRWAGGLAFVALLISPPVFASMRHDYLLTQTDTRTLAKEWIEANIPAGAKIAVDWPIHSPPISSATDPEPKPGAFYNLTVVGGKGLGDHPLAYYRENGFEYLITSSAIENIPVADPSQEAARDAFYAELNDSAVLLQTFQPFAGDEAPPFYFDQIYGPVTSLFKFERPGPTIKIYLLKVQ